MLLAGAAVELRLAAAFWLAMEVPAERLEGAEGQSLFGVGWKRKRHSRSTARASRGTRGGESSNLLGGGDRLAGDGGESSSVGKAETDALVDEGVVLDHGDLAMSASGIARGAGSAAACLRSKRSAQVFGPAPSSPSSKSLAVTTFLLSPGQRSIVKLNKSSQKTYE